MYNFKKTLLKKFENSASINDEKVVYMSDMHLGDLSAADETIRTKHLIFYALEYYLKNDFTLVLLGDTFELAETPDINKIKNAHDDILWLFSEFHKKGKLFIVKGNHEEFLKEKDLYKRTSLYDGKTIDFLPNVKIYNAVKDKEKVYAFHGNEFFFQYSSFLNKIIVKLGAIWKWWQLSHHDFHTSESTGWEKAEKLDKEYNNFAIELDKHFIVGHTHKCNFVLSNYTNSGSSGVMPRCITCVEHTPNKIDTIKFAEEADDNGFIKINKSILGTQKY